ADRTRPKTNRPQSRPVFFALASAWRPTEPNGALLQSFRNDLDAARGDHPFQPVIPVLAHDLPALQQVREVGHLVQYRLHLHPDLRDALALVHAIEPRRELRAFGRQVAVARGTVQVGNDAQVAPSKRIAVEPGLVAELAIQPALQ